MKSQIFQDEIDACSAGQEFILSMIPKDRHYTVCHHGISYRALIVDGGVICLWSGTTMLAQASVFRDDANNSVLTCVDLRENLEAEA